MNIRIVYILILTVSISLFAFDHAHAAFDTVLNEYVVVKGPQSVVKYKELKKNSTDLELYLQQIQTVSKEEYNNWSKQQQMAFLINAYNALTIKLILTEYPVKSIKKIGGFFTKPWKIEFFTFLGEKRHLDYIEHEILRKDFSDAYVHKFLHKILPYCPDRIYKD